MQTGLSLQALAAAITAQAGQKHDVVLDTRKLKMEVDAGKPVLFVPRTGQFNDERFHIRDGAHEQIANRLQIPAKYYDRMRADAPELLASNVNNWFQHKPERRMVRTLAGEARAFLSASYNRIENDEIARTVLPILLGIPGVQVVSSQITERRLYIQAVTPRRAAVKVGDEVQAGVIISNSETGHGAVSVKPMVYRLVCLNGLVMDDGKFRANHVGRRVEEGVLAAVNYADDTRQADDRAVLLKVRDHVAHAVGELGFNQHVERMKALAESREMQNPAAAIEVLAQKIGTSDSEGEDILRSLMAAKDFTAWGMVNAITAQAHSPAISYDRAVEFEALGGELVKMPSAGWREVLEAA